MATNPSKIEPEFVNAKDAGRLIGCSAWTIYELVKSGHLDAWMPRERQAMRFRIEDVRGLMKKRAPKAPRTQAADDASAAD